MHPKVAMLATGMLMVGMVAACGVADPTPLTTASTPNAPGTSASLLPVMLVRYGDDPNQVADLRVPTNGTPLPVAVLIHGGFWQEPFKRDLMDGLAIDLADRGFATLNLEYRRVGASGGGWPETALDVAAGIDVLVELSGDYLLDLSRVVVVGHSAGGHLALWAAGRAQLPPGAPGALPAVRPALAVSLAGVSDLEQADRTQLGGGAVAAFLGRNVDRTLLYPEASPKAMLPLGTPQLLVHGVEDQIVPLEQSESYVAAARSAGDEVELLRLAGAGHFVVIDERSKEWGMVADRIEVALGPPTR